MGEVVSVLHLRIPGWINYLIFSNSSCVGELEGELGSVSFDIPGWFEQLCWLDTPGS